MATSTWPECGPHIQRLGVGVGRLARRPVGRHHLVVEAVVVVPVAPSVHVVRHAELHALAHVHRRRHVQLERERVVGRPLALVLVDVRRLHIARRVPTIERVTDGDEFLEGDVLHLHGADDRVVSQDDVLEGDEAGLETFPAGQVVAGGLREIEDERRSLSGRGSRSLA